MLKHQVSLRILSPVTWNQFIKDFRNIINFQTALAECIHIFFVSGPQRIGPEYKIFKKHEPALLSHNSFQSKAPIMRK